MTLCPIFLDGPSGVLSERPTRLRGTPPPVLLCDRDGTIIANRDDYVREAAHVVPLPGAFAALRRAVSAGFAVVIVSNQSLVGRGKLSLDQVIQVHRVLLTLLSDAGVSITGTYLCPHAPEQGCPCRKPRAGMLESALDGYGFDPRRSAMIGDAIEDMLAARDAGVPGLLVRTGRGARHAELVGVHVGLSAFPIVTDLGAAVEIVHTCHPMENTCAG